ncbi:MAG TPA: hypothetical protein VNT20_18260 [Flavisolibacter sp.]|jgi:hypothetical protein|nr:hypothetical protein [Flavisolibacter sp.]
MIHLPNGCKCSELKVSPSNWQTPRASLRKKWYIYYRYYDPEYKETYPKGKLRVIKGMNDAPTLEKRQKLVKALIDLELSELKVLGYNPIIDRHITPISAAHLILPQTPLIHALRSAFLKANFTGRTYTDIKSVLKYVEKAALLAGLDCLLMLAFQQKTTNRQKRMWLPFHLLSGTPGRQLII